MVIEIKGLTDAQEIAIEDFFSKIQDCSEGRASRWIALFADGANEWHGVNITIDGKRPEGCKIPENAQRWWQMYFKEEGDIYSPEPFYLAESYTIEQALRESEHEEDRESSENGGDAS